MKRVLVTGSTGFIGKYIVSSLTNRGDDVLILTRNKHKAKKIFPNVTFIKEWAESSSLNGEKIDAVINLAGMNMDEKRWSTLVRRQLLDSRTESLNRLYELFKKLKIKPEVLISASGVDYYGSRGNETITEYSSAGFGFVPGLVLEWEKAAYEAADLGIRIVIMRTGFVLAKDSKALKKLTIPFRFLPGTYPGSGKQYLSWIHISDLVNAYLLTLDNTEISGAVNAVSPHPLTMKEFCRKTSMILHKRILVPVPGLIIKSFAGGISEMILSGRKAIPEILLKNGFVFKFHCVENALRDCLK
jgi:hypothetical protein